MFVTHPGAELRGSLRFADGSRQWAIVEQELAVPWLYVCVKQLDDCFDFQRMMLVSCVEHFRQLLESLPGNATVTCVMSVMPSDDGTGVWSMVPVHAIEVLEVDERSIFMINLANGTQYEELVRNVAELGGRRMVYRAC
ncbi:hypothetical protein SAMN02745900_03662 [Pseudomonas sp. URIL14HWK12:I8]|uniref:hypothetical protein n=1 Tax=unclassified Pseudomonas TaxID=196821 RepID=UPI00047F4682|nr:MULTISPECIES: hypothetical protein [unclassified Pseudomonas]SNB80318.1 hypothetical protein SAMN02745900_03662 [Pseudomonas sp. URIL14HWK12:I8]